MWHCGLKTSGPRLFPVLQPCFGIAASTQTPLTDRDHAASVTLVTGHLQDRPFDDWARLAGKGRTLGIYMGVRAAPDLSTGLIAAGVPADLPVAVVENGTRADERRFYGTLQSLPDLITNNTVKSPALLLIGDVVTTAADLNPLVAEAAPVAASAG